MRLTVKDECEINLIIRQFTDKEHEEVYREVDRLCSLRHANPIADAIADYFPSEFTQLASDYLSETDCDFQEKVAEVLWDLLTSRVIRERGIEIWVLQQQAQEVSW